MIDWVDPVTKVLTGLPQLVLDVYRMKRDGSVPEQLEYSAQQHAEELNQGHQLHLKEAVWETQLRVLEQVELARIAAEHAEGPFGHVTGEVVHTQVERLTDAGTRPALLVAPFLDTGRTRQDNIEQPYTYSVAIRSAWHDSPWSSDMLVDLGLIAQPLLRTDMNLRGIRELLADLPVVLAHGFVEGPDRVRLEIVAWNVISGSAEQPGRRAIQINISDAGTADGGPHPGTPAQVGLACSRLCAVLAEWSYVARGRTPRRHRDLPASLARSTAIGSLVALSLGLNRGEIDPLTALVHQAILHADLGEMALLDDAARSALKLLRGTDDDVAEPHLRELKRAAQEAASAAGATGATGATGDGTRRGEKLAASITARHDEVCRSIIRRQLHG